MSRILSSATFACTAALLLCGCLESPIDVPPGELAAGTWGGEDAGLIVNDTVAHVHVGCTYGNFPAPIRLDGDGRFSVSGDYLVKAYPVARGPTMPAKLAGVVRGRRLDLTVAVNDTIDKQLTVLGPVTLELGVDPRMRECPICVKPGDRTLTRKLAPEGWFRRTLRRFFSRP